MLSYGIHIFLGLLYRGLAYSSRKTKPFFLSGLKISSAGVTTMAAICEKNEDTMWAVRFGWLFILHVLHKSKCRSQSSMCVGKLNIVIIEYLI